MTGKGAVAASLPHEQEIRAKAEWPYEVGLVYLDDLVVDDTYQRPPHINFITEITVAFDSTLVGTLDVNKREDGTYAILDGQQRYRAMQAVGKTAAFCTIYEGMSLADEAGFFYRKNRDRKNMGPYYAFRARVVAGDPVAIAIRTAVESEGFSLAHSTNERDVIGAVIAAEAIYHMNSEHRAECLTPALRTIRESFFGRKESLSSSLLNGLGRFWRAFPDEEVDLTVLHEVLQTIGPTQLLGRAKDEYNLSESKRGRSLPVMVGRLAAEEYNRVKRAGRRGNFEGRLDPMRIV